MLKKKQMNGKQALLVSQAVLLFHYAVYAPAMAADPACTSERIWGSAPAPARAAVGASAAAAYATHLATLWSLRKEKHGGVWGTALAFYVLQTGFLPLLHHGDCRGLLPSQLTKILLGACAAAALWHAREVWALRGASWTSAGASFVAFHVTAVDLIYFGILTR